MSSDCQATSYSLCSILTNLKRIFIIVSVFQYSNCNYYSHSLLYSVCYLHWKHVVRKEKSMSWTKMVTNVVPDKCQSVKTNMTSSTVGHTGLLHQKDLWQTVQSRHICFADWLTCQLWSLLLSLSSSLTCNDFSPLHWLPM